LIIHEACSVSDVVKRSVIVSAALYSAISRVDSAAPSIDDGTNDRAIVQQRCVIDP